MLSILIPVYNYDICDLVKTLSRQAVKSKIPFEIVLIDDASDDEFRKINSKTSDLEGVVYYQEEMNLGRSKIRNKLADIAKYRNLLFLDCDSCIDSEDFVFNYIEYIGDSCVIYGGRKYKQMEPDEDKYRLHWLYGIKREQIPVKIRSQEPNKSFMTNNFLITREAFNKVRFNEKMKGYGHEDTLFGYELDKQNILICHVDNPVIHLGLESNVEFLRKTREGIKNLLRIMKINEDEKKLVKDVTLLSFYKKIKRFKLDGLVRLIYSRYEYQLRKNLLSKNPSMFYFDLYKLGYLCSLNDVLK